MRNIIIFFTRIYNFILYGIWRITENELSRTRRFGYRLVKIIVLAIRGFNNDKLNLKASALTYSILFAIVPMFALIIAIGRGFGIEKLIENSIRESFVAQSNMIPTILSFVTRYLETTQAGLFIGIGLAVLIFSVMVFFQQVELAFNSIWQVKKSRSIISQFTMYFSAMLIIPILMALSSGISIYINTTLSQTFLFNLLSPILRFGVIIVPYIINWILFTVLYIVIPNTRVRFINALIAGILAGTAFQIFQMLYINGQVYLSRYNDIYGIFAAIPLLLLWLQISCLIVLLGAEISYASQNIHNFDYEIDTENISNRYYNFITLFITYVVIKRFELQQPPITSDQIAIIHKLPIRLVNKVLTNLVETKILNEVLSDKNKAKSYQPAIDIHQLTVNLLFDKIDCNGSELFLTNKNEVLDSFWHKMLEMKAKSDLVNEKILVKDL